MPNSSATTSPNAIPAPRRVVLTDLLGPTAPTAVDWVELDSGILATYDPKRASYELAAEALRATLGRSIEIIDARQAAIR